MITRYDPHEGLRVAARNFLRSAPLPDIMYELLGGEKEFGKISDPNELTVLRSRLRTPEGFFNAGAIKTFKAASSIPLLLNPPNVVGWLEFEKKAGESFHRIHESLSVIETMATSRRAVSAKNKENLRRLTLDANNDMLLLARFLEDKACRMLHLVKPEHLSDEGVKNWVAIAHDKAWPDGRLAHDDIAGAAADIEGLANNMRVCARCLMHIQGEYAKQFGGIFPSGPAKA